jgi:integrase
VRRNPADAVDKPKLKRAEMKTLTLEQTRSFLHATEGHRLESLFHLAIHTGLRQGEILGLRWSDLDWKTGALQVQRQVKRISGEGLQFSEPKTASGRRLVKLGSAMLAKLREHHKRQLEERIFVGLQWQDQGMIFTSTVGTVLDQRNVHREFKLLLGKADLPDIRFHDLRHTAATLMLQQGIHPKVVQERLGHSEIGITLNIYSHVLPSMQEDAAERMDSLLG